ncbi:MAG: hypothetical protein Q9200_003418 [Gallowayella weberi]
MILELFSSASSIKTPHTGDEGFDALTAEGKGPEARHKARVGAQADILYERLKQDLDDDLTGDSLNLSAVLVDGRVSDAN